MAGSAKRKPYVYLCGVPKEHCSGSSAPFNAMLKGGVGRAHSSSEAAFSCHKNWLVNVLGYTVKGDSRTLHPPDGGPARVLTKASRFGAKMRNGKGGTRNMPHVRGHRAGARGGTIVST